MVIVPNEKIMTLLFSKCNLLWAEQYIMKYIYFFSSIQVQEMVKVKIQREVHPNLHPNFHLVYT